MDALLKELRESVDCLHESLRSKVINVLRAVDTYSFSATIPGFMAEGLIRRHQQVSSDYAGPDSSEMHRALRLLWVSEDGSELIDPIVAGSLDRAKSSTSGPPRLSGNGYLVVDADGSSLRKELTAFVDHIRKALRPLFVRDLDLGYFTCVDTKECRYIYPWKMRA